MQSSTAIAFRAVIMLVVLISVPLFAIFGKSLPDVVKGLMEGRGLVLGPAPGADANAGANPPANAPQPGANNPFAQSGSYRASPDASASINAANGPMNGSSGAPAILGSSTQPPSAGLASAGVPGAPSPSVPANSMAVGGSNPPNGMAGNRLQQLTPSSAPGNLEPAAIPAMLTAQPTVPVPSMPNNVRTPVANTSGAQPPNFLTTPEGTPLAPASSPNREITMTSATDAPGDSPYVKKTATNNQPAANDEKFRQAEMRLRELGATHYMLETWGPDNNRYRFVCKMAIGGNAEVNRYFQAIDDNPWQAMETVLRQIEDWRARQSQ